MALADAPVVQCKDMAQALPPGDRSVVWVSPLQRRARGWLTVMDAGTLRQWVEQEDPDEGQYEGDREGDGKGSSEYFGQTKEEDHPRFKGCESR